MTATAPGTGARPGPVGGTLPSARTRPLPAGAVRLGPSGLLGRWQQRNAAATVPHCLGALETSGALDNLRRLLDPADPEHHAGPYRGFNFADSDVHKTLEAIAWESARSGAAPHEAEVRRVVDLLRRVQGPSGYLDSHVLGSDGTAGTAPSPEPYADLRWGHELYVLGHLVQAGVARARATGQDDLLDVAMTWADDVVSRLAAGEELVCGHPEVESAFVELFRETGDAAYLEAVRRMLELRGHGRLGSGPFEPAYHQDATPVREATEVAGHAVRQLYLLAGVVDLYLETGEDALLAAAARQWDDVHGRRTYVTGGMGSRHKDESFGDPFELPPDRAYAESCAGVASVLWDWRMLLATGEARYADSLEHALLNVVAAATSTDGTAFFYSNPLQVRTGHDGADEYQASGRRGWFACACCPPNLARLVASLHTMVATRDGDGALVVHLYGDADLEADLGSELGAGPGTGAPLRLAMRTGYPWDGDVVLTADAPSPVPLALRLPGWADAARTRLDVDGVEVDVPTALDGRGYLRIGAGARVVRLSLPMEPRAITAHPHVDAVRGCVALARGPVVHCLEQVDHAGVVLEDVVLDVAAGLEVGPPDDTLGVGATLVGTGRATPAAGTPLYRDRARDAAGGGVEGGVELPVRAVPYAVWGNRGEGPMRVWIPVAAPPRPGDRRRSGR
ncbi:glycoside hydrolase family 127 protein [Isoptericola sp. NPDC019693]|uniref:glycoside hydrolase family 127 protein n=1 Tax=Isoptericola sp. NPDC019693 TaxID=3364009 RepID=UPI0037A98495